MANPSDPSKPEASLRELLQMLECGDLSPAEQMQLAEALSARDEAGAVGPLSETSPVPDDWRGAARAYRAGWNDRHACIATPPAASGDGCPKCGSVGLHACTGQPMRPWTEQEEADCLSAMQRIVDRESGEELFRLLAQVGVVGQIDGFDVIRRESVLELTRRRLAAVAPPAADDDLIERMARAICVFSWDTATERVKNECRWTARRAATALASVAPAGMVLVPREPTPEILRAMVYVMPQQIRQWVDGEGHHVEVRPYSHHERLAREIYTEALTAALAARTGKAHG